MKMPSMLHAIVQIFKKLQLNVFNCTRQHKNLKPLVINRNYWVNFKNISPVWLSLSIYCIIKYVYSDLVRKECLFLLHFSMSCFSEIIRPGSVIAMIGVHRKIKKKCSIFMSTRPTLHRKFETNIPRHETARPRC